MSFRNSFSWAQFLMILLAAALIGCGDNSQQNSVSLQPEQGESLEIGFEYSAQSAFASAAASAEAIVIIENQDTITKELTVERNRTWGQLENMPVGKNLTITVNIYSHSGNLCYQGHQSATVKSQARTQVNIHLYPATDEAGTVVINGIIHNGREDESENESINDDETDEDGDGVENSEEQGETDVTDSTFADSTETVEDTDSTSNTPTQEPSDSAQTEAPESLISTMPLTADEYTMYFWRWDSMLITDQGAMELADLAGNRNAVLKNCEYTDRGIEMPTDSSFIWVGDSILPDRELASGSMEIWITMPEGDVTPGPFIITGDEGKRMTLWWDGSGFTWYKNNDDLYQTLRYEKSYISGEEIHFSLEWGPELGMAVVQNGEVVAHEDFFSPYQLSTRNWSHENEFRIGKYVFGTVGAWELRNATTFQGIFHGARLSTTRRFTSGS